MTTNSTATSHRTLDWLAATPRIDVPVYQREYRWTENACEKLLQDVRSIARGSAGSTHFLGSVLAKPDAEGRVTLVDGQQRLITVQLLLAAVARACRGDETGPGGRILGLLTDPAEPSSTRLRPHQRDEHELRSLLLGTGESADDSPFADNLRFLIDRIGSDWQDVWTGLQRLEHVTIGLGADANAQQIFESLNSTGARLSDDELIHNFVHMGRSHEEQLALEHETWIPIETATAGHTREFWRDYLILTADEVPDLSGEFGVFNAFKARYPDPVGDLSYDLRQEWREYAELYGVILHPERAEQRHPAISTQLRLLQVFGGTPRPLMLAIYRDVRTSRLTDATAVALFEALQSLFIRRSLVGLERDVPMIARLCVEFREGGEAPDRPDVLEGLVRRTPEDPAVRLALAHGGVPQATYVLRRLQFDDRTDPEGDALQVEHIHPQNPGPSWSGNAPRSWGELSIADQADYRSLLDTIGNLTLLEARLNQGAGNKSLRDKARYYSDSAVPETKNFETAGTWDREAIQRRTARLTEAFLEQWPRSSSTPMTIVDDLLKVVDLARPALRGHPDVFEYANFEGALWGDVHTSRQLLVRLVDELCRIDLDAFEATDYGRRYLRTAKQPRCFPLSNGRWIYAGWAHQYLLEAAQRLLMDFGLEDSLRVKPSTSPVLEAERP